MNKTSWIKIIYLYLFSLVGLVLVIIGGVRFIDMGLKTFFFKQADQDQRLNYSQPTMPYSVSKLERMAESQDGGAQLTEDERASIRQWLEDYRVWKEQRDQVDMVTAQRQRQASSNLAMIIVGVPLFLYHWRLARKEGKNSNA